MATLNIKKLHQQIMKKSSLSEKISLFFFSLQMLQLIIPEAVHFLTAIYFFHLSHMLGVI